jgi:uncharacterized membrane protein
MMATESRNEATVAGLLRGVVDDIRDLFRQEIALARYEIRDEISKARAAAIAYGVAGATLAAAGLLLLFAIGRGIAALLNWPVWAGYGLFAIVLGIAGLALLSYAQSQMRRVKAVPEQTVKTMKENVEWIKEKSSDRT